MNKIESWSELFLNSLQAFGQKFMETLPNIIGAILILIIGYLLAKVFSKGVTRLFKAIGTDQLAEKINATDFLDKANLKMTFSQLIGKFMYWLILLLVIISASDVMGWHAVSEEISKLISLIPNILIALIIFVVGAYIARIIKNIIVSATSSLGISTGKILGNTIFFILMVMITLTALRQAGINIDIITSNLLLILGAVLAAAAISYALASKDVLANILSSFFNKQHFQVGQVIRLSDVEGEIIVVSNTSVIIKTQEGDRIVIPASQLFNNRVVVKDKNAKE